MRVGLLKNALDTDFQIRTAIANRQEDAKANLGHGLLMHPLPGPSEKERPETAIERWS